MNSAPAPTRDEPAAMQPPKHWATDIARGSRLAPWLVFAISAAVVAIICGGPLLWWNSSFRPKPPVEIDEPEWPKMFRSLVASAELTTLEMAQVRVIYRQQLMDSSSVLRMPATDAAVAFVADQVPPIDEAAIHPSFWSHGVTRDEFGPSAELSFYATIDRAVDTGEEYVAVHDRSKNRLVMCFRRVF